ncbi:1,4-dihydroxy-2-naphthoate octaprenyltransferase [Kiritimatiellota bacterium B12222]|nr:1,4-dihydroxy-2-naphthoate octaprenyltransferase [Kiritimatiellota bacterium B12222]
MTAEPSLFKLWVISTRPKTLFAALSPVLMGGSMAFAQKGFHAGYWLATLVIALLIQIGTNFCNDVFDQRQGADTPDRQGPLRGLHSGRISIRALSTATVACFVAVALISAVLIQRGGSPIIWLAVSSIFCAVFYTAGPYSLAYTGLADIFVLAYFGPIAVAGTYYLQLPETGWPPVEVFIAGLGPGLIATALLTVNNLRDVDEDKGNHKRTLAVRFGRTFSRTEYTVCMLGSLLVPGIAAGVAGRGWASCLVLILLVMVGPLILLVRKGNTGAELNPVLAKTGKCLFLYAILFSVTWPLGS